MIPTVIPTDTTVFIFLRNENIVWVGIARGVVLWQLKYDYFLKPLLYDVSSNHQNTTWDTRLIDFNVNDLYNY